MGDLCPFVEVPSAVNTVIGIDARSKSHDFGKALHVVHYRDFELHHFFVITHYILGIVSFKIKDNHTTTE